MALYYAVTPNAEIQSHIVDGLIFVGYQFSWLSWRVRSKNSSTHELVIFCMNYEGKYYDHKFEPHECVIFVQSTKIDTHKNKGFHSNHICIRFDLFKKTIERDSINPYTIFPNLACIQHTQ